MRKIQLAVLAVFLVAASSRCDVTAAPAQQARPNQALPEIMRLDQVPKSQAAVVTQRVATTEITVTYSRPVARGRELFGALVPFGDVWNPGANDATAVAFSRDVIVDGQPLAAGKYSVWAIPGRETWTLILSRAGDVFHIPYPGEAQDALRWSIKAIRGPHMEALTFLFPEVEGKTAVLRLHWGTVMVSMTVVVP